MIDEHTGKTLVSPLDLTTPEKAIINMLAELGKTGDEAADFLSNLATAIRAVGFTACSTVLAQPLSTISDLVDL